MLVSISVSRLEPPAGEAWPARRGDTMVGATQDDLPSRPRRPPLLATSPRAVLIRQPAFFVVKIQQMMRDDGDNEEKSAARSFLIIAFYRLYSPLARDMASSFAHAMNT